MDGRDYISEALERGAVAILAEAGNHAQLDYIQDQIKNTQNNKNSKNNKAPLICYELDNIQQSISQIAAQFYDEPSKKLSVTGVTGTNGKTSCSHFIAQVFKLSDN